MRIAQVAPVFESVPPRGYGGTERVVSYLTETLVELGHDVTLFASGDSVTSAELVPVSEHSLRSEPDFVCAAWHTLMLDQVFARASEFDIIHFHLDFLHYPMMRRCPTTCVTTLHGRLDMPHVQMLHRHFAEHPVVSISDHQRGPLPGAHFVATVHHGLPLGLYAFTPVPQDYFAFVGRVSPEKRLDRAIEIALACNTRLVIAAKVDNKDRDYFEREIQPLLSHPLLSFIGEVDDAGKNSLLGNAKALLFPIDWPEPFGLVVVESLACGTPVIAYRHGSMPELLDHGTTGFLVDNQDAAIDAARRIGEIDRRRCRDVFEARFASTTMARRYLSVYGQLMRARHRVPLDLPRPPTGADAIVTRPSTTAATAAAK
jgi:glycosyltransferase involved in cell wall biosynthesis